MRKSLGLSVLITGLLALVASRVFSYPSYLPTRAVSLPAEVARDAQNLTFFDQAGHPLESWQWKDGVWKTQSPGQVVSRETIQRLLLGLSSPLVPSDTKDTTSSGLNPPQGSLEIRCRSGAFYRILIGYSSAEVEGTLVKMEGQYPVVAGPPLLSAVVSGQAGRAYYSGLLPLSPQSVRSIYMKDEKLSSLFERQVSIDPETKQERMYWTWSGSESNGRIFSGLARPNLIPTLIGELASIQTGPAAQEAQGVGTKYKTTSITIYSSDDPEPYELQLKSSGKEVRANRGRAGLVAVPAEKSVDFGRLQFEIGDRRILPTERTDFQRIELRLSQSVIVLMNSGSQWTVFRSGARQSHENGTDVNTQREYSNAAISEMLRLILVSEWPIPSLKPISKRADLEISLQFFTGSKGSPLKLGLAFFPDNKLRAEMPNGRLVVLEGESVRELRERVQMVVNLKNSN